MSKGLPKRAEQRHYKRIDSELPVKLETGGQSIESTTENISCGGMFLPNIQTDLKEDDTLTAFITLPEDCKVVKMSGRVCRVRNNTDSQDSGVAIQFSGLYDENHLEIDRYVKWKLLN